jgi:plasmid replication initiation protein
MVGGASNSKDRSPLLPKRHPIEDFFVCNIADAIPKGDMASMEHPVFSLSSKPDTRVRTYENNGVQISIKPSVEGLATIHDRDILIYCISQLVAAMNEGKEVTSVVRFRAYDMLVATNRNTAGSGYAQLKAAMERLAGTRISTNIKTGGQEIFSNFGLVDRATVVRKTRDGRMQEVEIKLSDWIFNAVQAKEVLTLHRDYFRLRKPVERRIYEIARKHCGSKNEWRISLALLHKKCGSYSPLWEFRRLILSVVKADQEHQHMPDYAVTYDSDEDMLVLTSRKTVKEVQVVLPATAPPLDPEIYEIARMIAPGWDIRHIEREWREWLPETPTNPEAAFLGFCKKWVQNRDDLSQEDGTF